MKIVIDIDEEVYIKAQAGILGSFGEIIANGTPLPEGHGDLIDIKALKGELWWVTDCPRVKLNDQALELWKAIDTAKTVIPADKE